MKTCTWILTLVTAFMLAGLGCNKGGGSVDASPVEKAFASADPALKSAADTAIKAIKSSDYPAALAELQKLVAQAKITPEQQQAVKGVIEQIQKALASGAEKAAKDANKALGDAQKALGK